MKDTIPSYSDSSCGIRFINLSPDSEPLSIDIAGNANGSEVGSLAYKSITGFKTYSATAEDNLNGYTFEVRNAADGTLLTSVFVTPPFFKNVTVAINGLEGDGTISAFVVNNY